MDQDFIVPRVAFVINLASNDSTQLSPARLRHLIHLFRSHRIQATWAVEDASMANLLQEQNSKLSPDRLALDLQSLESSPALANREFNAMLTAKLNSLAASMSEVPSAVYSHRAELRAQLPLLSQWGIRTVISVDRQQSSSTKPRALSCGLWQVKPSIELPRRGAWQSLLRRGPSVREISAAAVHGMVLVRVNSADFQKQSARQVQSFEKFLREASWGASRGQVELCSLAEIVDGLARRNRVRPQQSILKMAA